LSSPQLLAAIEDSTVGGMMVTANPLMLYRISGLAIKNVNLGVCGTRLPLQPPLAHRDVNNLILRMLTLELASYHPHRRHGRTGEKPRHGATRENRRNSDESKE